MKIKSLALASTMMMLAPIANAHTPYLKPLSFEPVSRDSMTLDASFAEQFFVPEVAISNAPFEVEQPDGSIVPVETVVNLKTRNVLEQTLEQEGTYKFSTGKRLGAIFRVYDLNGERGSVRGNEEPLPEGAVLTEHFQSVTSAVAYVTKKGPTEKVLAGTGKGLEIVPATHPNGLFAGDRFEFTLQYEGKPLAEQTVTVYFANDQFSEEADFQKLTTNSKGVASATLDKQGLYLLQVRVKEAAPEGEAVPLYSYTTTLTLEAF